LTQTEEIGVKSLTASYGGLTNAVGLMACVDEDGLTEQVGQFVGEHAADDVGGPAGRERHDEADGAIGIPGIGAHDGGRCEHAEAGGKQMTAFHVVTPCMLGCLSVQALH
jgi:hypothetical protein